MRYFWLLFASAFLGFGVLFADQNKDLVTVRFSLEWLNVHLTSGQHPIFISVFAALAFGIFFTTLYFLFYHSYLRIRIKSQESEIYRLKKLVLLEREKNRKTQSRVELPQGDSESSSKNSFAQNNEVSESNNTSSANKEIPEKSMSE